MSKDYFIVELEKLGKLKELGAVSNEDWLEVHNVGNEVYKKLDNLDLAFKATNDKELSRMKEHLKKEFKIYLKQLIESSEKKLVVQPRYYTLLSKISRLQEKAGLKRNG